MVHYHPRNHTYHIRTRKPPTPVTHTHTTPRPTTTTIPPETTHPTPHTYTHTHDSPGTHTTHPKMIIYVLVGTPARLNPYARLSDAAGICIWAHIDAGCEGNVEVGG